MNPPNMYTFEARLASFEKIQAGPKRRNSNAKGAKGTKWPHKSPGAVDLARAGFFFKPTTSAPDNVQCFSCEKELDGWDEEDVAILEHRQLSPDCGFALNLGIEYDMENDRFEPNDTDPLKILEARRATFKDKWPHEDKRGWTCKTQKMADGGWYFCPTPENDDMVKCAYCGLSLDGWEPKDNPLNEHQRRAPDCLFFTEALGKPTKASRAAKGRLSKASRLSTQSNITTHTIDESLDDGNSAMTDLTITSTASKSTKKTAKGRKAKNKTKEAAAPKPEPVTGYDNDDVDMGEPEDAGFDVVISIPPSKPKKGKKRTSEEMELHDQRDTINQDAVLEPPPKRRATRMRSSTVKPEQVSIVEIARKDQDGDTASSGKEEPATEKPVRSKKGLKGNRKRASSTIRKASNTSVRNASNTSTASKAALRAAGPTDEEVDAVLAADLDRPLTDEEIEQEEVDEPKAKTRRLTRTKPGSRTTSRTVSASKAPIRKAARAGTESQKDNSRLEMSQTNYGDLEQEAIMPSQDPSSLNVKPNKGRKAAKAVKSKSVNNPGETSISMETVAESEQPAPEDVGSPTHSMTMLHHDVAADISLEIPVLIDEDTSAQTKSINTRASAGPIGQERSISHDTVEVGEEKPTKARKVEIKIEIPRLSSQSHRQIEKGQDDSAASIADDEKGGQATKPAAPKKHNAKKGSGKTSKAKTKAVVTTLPRQPSAEPVLTQATLLLATKAATPRNIQTLSPAVVINVDKQAAHVEAMSPTPPKKFDAPTPSPSLQSSDAENHPPSTRPVEKRPPLAQLSPSKTQTTRVPLAASTPTDSPSKRNVAARIQTDAPWTAIDLENVFGAVDTPAPGLELVLLSSPEKRMTVEEWIVYNAAQGDERLKRECERVVGAFEMESLKALRSLEGVVCVN